MTKKKLLISSSIITTATASYDDFTEAKYKELLASGDGYIDDSWPAAYFRIDSATSVFEQVITPNRYVLNTSKFYIIRQHKFVQSMYRSNDLFPTCDH